MKFEIYGPFEIPREGNLITRDNRKKREFWQSVNADCCGLPEACGCYVFVIRGIARYVGLAAKQSFRNECFTAHKLNVLNQGLHDTMSGAPYFYFVPKITPNLRFAKPSRNGAKDIEFLETLLIGMATQRNPDMLNIRGTRFLREMHVQGVLNAKKGENRMRAVQSFRKAISVQ